MRSPVQFGQLKRAELNMDMRRDGCLCTAECNNNAARYCLWNNSYIPYWADAPRKTQAITLVCDFGHFVGGTQVTGERVFAAQGQKTTELVESTVEEKNQPAVKSFN